MPPPQLAAGGYQINAPLTGLALADAAYRHGRSSAQAELFSDFARYSS